MAFPPANYVACFPLQAYFVDKDTGAPLSGGTIYFFEDEARTVPKNVFVQQQQPDLSYVFINIGSQVGLSSVGTTQYLGTDTIIFLYPFDAKGNEELYYIEVFSAQGVLQFTREAWPPNTSANFTPSAGTFAGSQNVVSNPQFCEVLFPPAPASATTFTIGSASTTQIAPDWTVITPSGGTLVVTQIAETDTAAPGLPAFGLEVNCSGFSGPVVLAQKISMSPRLLENGFVSGSFIAQSGSGTPTLSMQFLPSNPSLAPIIVCSGVATLGGYALIANSVATPVGGSINSDAGNTGYVQVQINIPNGSDVTISCVQLVSVSALSVVPNYIQESTPRQQDHLFHYWQPALNYKPIPSYLVGWDFPLNPAQFGTSGGPNTLGGTNLSQYIWDQTILFSAVDNKLSWARNTDTNGLSVATSSASAFAIIQYLSAAQAREILSQRNSVKLKGFLSGGTGTLAGQVSLWWSTASIPNITSGNAFSLVNGVDATTGIATTGGGSYGTWTQVPNIYKNGAFTLTTTDSEFGFNGFDATSGTGGTTATSFAIVVSFAALASTQTATIDYCSLVGGDIATRPSPQTPDEVLRECQYYYESTYPVGNAAGTVETTNSVYAIQNTITTGGNDKLLATAFGYQYKVNKRIVPGLTFYSGATGTSGKIEGYLYQSGNSVAQAEITFSDGWTNLTSGTKGFIYTTTGSIKTYLSTAAGTVPQAFISYHNIADARLGVV